MRRTRRIAATLAAATGVLAGAGGVVAYAESPGAEPETAPAAATTTVPVGAGTDTAARDALQAYVTSMSAREVALEDRVSTARGRLAHVRAVRAARLAAARAAAAAAAARQQAARQQAAAAAAARGRTRHAHLDRGQRLRRRGAGRRRARARGGSTAMTDTPRTAAGWRPPSSWPPLRPPRSRWPPAGRWRTRRRVQRRRPHRSSPRGPRGATAVDHTDIRLHRQALAAQARVVQLTRALHRLRARTGALRAAPLRACGGSGGGYAAGAGRRGVRPGPPVAAAPAPATHTSTGAS